MEEIEVQGSTFMVMSSEEAQDMIRSRSKRVTTIVAHDKSSWDKRPYWILNTKDGEVRLLWTGNGYQLLLPIKDKVIQIHSVGPCPKSLPQPIRLEAEKILQNFNIVKRDR